MTSVVRMYEDLTLLTPTVRFKATKKLSNRARKYMGFVNFLILHAKVGKGNAITFPKRLAMEFVGDGDRNDLYAVNRALDDILETNFEWQIHSADGGRPIKLKGNPVTFTIDAGKRGWAGIKVDPDFIASVRGENSHFVEMMFSYSFLLADVNHAYDHALLFALIWAQEIKNTPDIQEVVATISLEYYREAVGVEEGLYLKTRDLVRYVIKPAVEANNSRTRLDVSYKLEAENSGRKTTHITFTIRRKQSFQLSMDFGADKLHTLHGYLQDIVDLDTQKALPQTKQLTKPEGMNSDQLRALSPNDNLYSAVQGILAVGVSEKELLEFLNRWKEQAIVEIWEAFDKRRNNPSGEEIRSEKAYLLKLLRSGEGRKTPEQREAEKSQKTKTQNIIKAREDREQAKQEAEQVKSDWLEAKQKEGRRLFVALSNQDRAALISDLDQSPTLNNRVLGKYWKTVRDNADDLNLLDQNDKMVGQVLYSVFGASVEKFGNKEYLTVGAYCEKNQVKQSIIDVLIRNGDISK